MPANEVMDHRTATTLSTFLKQFNSQLHSKHIFLYRQITIYLIFHQRSFFSAECHCGKLPLVKIQRTIDNRVSVPFQYIHNIISVTKI